jgi:hypothetical protein
MAKCGLAGLFQGGSNLFGGTLDYLEQQVRQQLEPNLPVLSFQLWEA